MGGDKLGGEMSKINFIFIFQIERSLLMIFL